MQIIMKILFKNKILILSAIFVFFALNTVQVFAQGSSYGPVAPNSSIYGPVTPGGDGSVSGPVAVSFCPGSTDSITGLIHWVICLITDSIMPLLVTAGIAYFIYGVIRYVIAGDSKEREEGKQLMIWGIIGLFAIVSMWGLVKLLAATFNISFVIPQLQQ